MGWRARVTCDAEEERSSGACAYAGYRSSRRPAGASACVWRTEADWRLTMRPWRNAKARRDCRRWKLWGRYFMGPVLVGTCGCPIDPILNWEVYEARTPTGTVITATTTREGPLDRRGRYNYDPEITIREPDGTTTVLNFELWSRAPETFRVTLCSPSGETSEVPLRLVYRGMTSPTLATRPAPARE